MYQIHVSRDQNNFISCTQVIYLEYLSLYCKIKVKLAIVSSIFAKLTIDNAMNYTSSQLNLKNCPCFLISRKHWVSRIQPLRNCSKN